MLVRLSAKDSSTVSLIHSKALGGDFLPSLGLNFLTTFYSGILSKREVYGFGFRVGGGIVGFVLGTSDSKGFFKLALKSNFLSLSFYLLVELIKRPWLFKNVLETFLYTSKDKGPNAELVVIAVLDKYQGIGIGKTLAKALEKAFLNDDIAEYKLTVHASKKAVHFYEHLKYERISSFNLYGKLWYVYGKSLRFDKAKHHAKRISKHGKTSQKR